MVRQIIQSHGKATIQIISEAKQVIAGRKWNGPVVVPGNGLEKKRTVPGETATFSWLQAKPVVTKSAAKFLHGLFITEAGFAAAAHPDPDKTVNKKNPKHIYRERNQGRYEKLLELMGEDVIEGGNVKIDNVTGEAYRRSFEEANALLLEEETAPAKKK